MAYDPPEIQSMFLWDGYRKNVKKIVEYVVKGFPAPAGPNLGKAWSLLHHCLYSRPGQGWGRAGTDPGSRKRHIYLRTPAKKHDEWQGLARMSGKYGMYSEDSTSLALSQAGEKDQWLFLRTKFATVRIFHRFFANPSLQNRVFF